jgi:hypothetical protein
MSTVTKRGGKSMFTTQHYKAIAEVVHATTPDGLTGVAYRTKLVDALCELFKSDNDRFKSGSFMAATGILDAPADEPGCKFCDTTDTGRFDDDGTVCVDCKSSCFVAAQWPGVAVRFVGYVTETVHPECPGHSAADEPNDGHAGIGDVVYCDGSCQSAETETDYGTARVVMVGDDREHEVALDDLIDVDDADFCSECGQVGCGHDGRVEEA